MSVAHKTDKTNAKHAPATSASENLEKRIPHLSYFFLFFILCIIFYSFNQKLFFW